MANGASSSLSIQRAPNSTNSLNVMGFAAHGSHHPMSQAYSTNTARMSSLHGALEQRLVEIAELVLDVERYVDPGRQLDGAIIGGLDPAVAGERIDDEILRTVGVHGAEAERQHEFRGVVTHL